MWMEGFWALLVVGMNKVLLTYIVLEYKWWTKGSLCSVGP